MLSAARNRAILHVGMVRAVAFTGLWAAVGFGCSDSTPPKTTVCADPQTTTLEVELDGVRVQALIGEAGQ